MSANDLETALRQFEGDYPLILIMCDLAGKSDFCEFDRAAVAANFPSAPTTLTRFCDAGLIQKGSRPTGRRGQICYTMPRHAEIRATILSGSADLTQRWWSAGCRACRLSVCDESPVARAGVNPARLEDESNHSNGLRVQRALAP